MGHFHPGASFVWPVVVLASSVWSGLSAPGVKPHTLLPLVALEGHNIHQIVVGHHNLRVLAVQPCAVQHLQSQNYSFDQRITLNRKGSLKGQLGEDIGI